VPAAHFLGPGPSLVLALRVEFAELCGGCARAPLESRAMTGVKGDGQ